MPGKDNAISPPPNILFIQADQHRYDCLGRSEGYPVVTPNLDALAAEGLWFEHAYTPIPTCCPARQALLTGRRPESFGSLWNYDLTLPTGALEPAEFTWPRALQESGYRTGYCGKWHVHPEHGPDRYGFDDVVADTEYAAHIAARHPGLEWKNGYFGEKSPLPVEDAHTHYMASRTIDLLRAYSAEGRPWHLRLDFHDPHLPCRPSEPFASMYDPKEIPVWRSFGDELTDKPYIQRQQLRNWGVEDYTWQDWAPTVARYYAAISQVDDAVGKVLAELEALGCTDDTIVVYTADHGDLCGAHGMMDKHYVMYDDVVRVPLILRWPDGIAAGGERAEFVYNALDLPPTLLEVAGLPAPDTMAGRSMLPLAAGEAPDDWRAEVVSTHNGQQFGLFNQRMLRTHDWKYTWNPTDVDELYDLRADPDELRNRIHAPATQNIVAELRVRLYELLTESGDRLVANQWMRDQLLTGNKA